jgi:hypothetical protein
VTTAQKSQTNETDRVLARTAAAAPRERIEGTTVRSLVELSSTARRQQNTAIVVAISMEFGLIPDERKRTIGVMATAAATVGHFGFRNCLKAAKDAA